MFGDRLLHRYCPIGGTDRVEISRALMEVDCLAEFAHQQRLGYVHTGERIAKVLREIAAPVAGTPWLR